MCCSSKSSNESTIPNIVTVVKEFYKNTAGGIAELIIAIKHGCPVGASKVYLALLDKLETQLRTLQVIEWNRLQADDTAAFRDVSRKVESLRDNLYCIHLLMREGQMKIGKPAVSDKRLVESVCELLTHFKEQAAKGGECSGAAEMLVHCHRMIAAAAHPHS